MKKLLVLVPLLFACDRGARKDLPNENQQLDESNATIIVMPDRFPNLAHKCLDSTGFWTTTSGLVVIMYNDPSCPGSEGTPFVIDNVPGAQNQIQE